MSTDFRKQFENPDGFDFTAKPVDSAEAPAAAPQVDEQFRNAAYFPLAWWAKLIQYGFPAAAFGYVVYLAGTGDPERDLGSILIACAGVLAGLCLLPNTMVVDDRGVHQVFVLGLYTDTLRLSEVRHDWSTTRRELRQAGKLRFEFPGEANNNNDFEEVVFVEGKYGRRYLIHGKMHTARYRFIEELEKRGIPPKGYEDWNKYMEARGFPMEAGR